MILGWTVLQKFFKARARIFGSSCGCLKRIYLFRITSNVSKERSYKVYCLISNESDSWKYVWDYWNPCECPIMRPVSLEWFKNIFCTKCILILYLYLYIFRVKVAHRTKHLTGTKTCTSKCIPVWKVSETPLAFIIIQFAYFF